MPRQHFPRRRPALTTAVVLLATGSWVGCSDGAGPDLHLNVTVTSPVDAVDALGETVQFTAVVSDASGAPVTGHRVEWASLTPNVATVDGAGRVLSVGPGTARIQAAVGRSTGSAELVVAQVIRAVRAARPTQSVGVRDTLQLVAIAVDANDAAVEGATFEWTSSDDATVSVDEQGRAIGHREGSAVLRATLGEMTAEITVSAFHVLALARETGANGYGIFRVYSNGEGLRRIGPQDGQSIQPAWSPDGARILFHHRPEVAPGPGSLYVMRADGSGMRPLPTGDLYPGGAVWSPDGSRIAFSGWTDGGDGGSDIFIMNADGSNIVNLTNDAHVNEKPTWSPDGTRIAFTSDRAVGAETPDDVYVMNVDGTDIRSLSNRVATFTGEPAWSPDGSLIALQSSAGEGSGIHVIRPDGTGMRLVVDGGLDRVFSHPSWAPDGARLAVLGGLNGTQDIHVINLDGSGLRALVRDVTLDQDPVWRP